MIALQVLRGIYLTSSSLVVGTEQGTLSALSSFMFSFPETVDSCWQYDTGVDYEGTPRTKLGLEGAHACVSGPRLDPSCAHAVRMWALPSGTPAAPPRRGNQALAAGSETRRRSVDGVRLLRE